MNTQKSTLKASKAKQINQRLALVTWYKVILCIWCFIFAICFTNNANAQVTDAENAHTVNESALVKSHKIVERFRKESQPSTKQQEETTLSEADDVILITPLSREQHLLQKQQSTPKGNHQKSKRNLAKVIIQEFHIFDAYSQLFDDYDGDGFYQTFSVAFDADVYTYNGVDQANVYAEIYLSNNGGPWEYFHTTDNFIIYGESTDDEYEVLSNLTSGYNTAHYDVLIDLYEVGYSGIIATYSSDDNNSLYALPLESDEYDTVHHHDDHHGGSTSMIIIGLLGLIILARKLRIFYKIAD
ncbi:hypothetical protein HII17_06550 [Thalassotalea sp. M1531]|uniref:GlyGly-CTERM sorting domain-containing protein n=1 Tax=Thalassotalea algicola TaxID=2716224 RepID=A0A7Y0LAZ8_9GAMM|nr:choice-of-anchor H family protein [Thalassotalea algicola]NMP31215.1 hypothetical protein [Thalassotalea algicola]